MIQEEMEVLAEMIPPQMTADERARMLEVLEKTVLCREMIEKGRIQGKIEDTQETIQKFLASRFGTDLSELRREILQINDLEILDNLLMDLFGSNSVEEARVIIDGVAKKNAGKPE